MKEYYRHQGELPVPVNGLGTNPIVGQVPVDNLNLESKFQFDGFGQQIEYHLHDNIAGVNVNGEFDASGEFDGGTNVAAVLISSGGDQTIQANTQTTHGTSGNVIYIAHGDDIVTPVNVNREATEIALDEVRELQRRVNQYDNLFPLGSPPVDPCEFANLIAASNCPPRQSSDLDGTNNPNCGTATLDQIEENTATYGSCTSTDNALNIIVTFYGLSDQYLEDPWGNPYQWGCSSNTDESGNPISSGICSSAPRFRTSDPQYRKFFSLGPNGCTWTDNVTTGGEGDCVSGYTLSGDEDEDDDDIIP